MAKILVTGATGNVGRYLVKELAENGHEVKGLTRRPEDAEFPEGVEAVKGDIGDVQTLRGLFNGLDAVHLVTFAGDNYEPIPDAEEIVAELERAGVKRVTLLKGDVEDSELETAIKGSDIEWTALAPVEFMANAYEWVEGVRNGKVHAGFVDVPSTVVHEADIASVAAKPLAEGQYGSQTLWVTGPEAFSPRQRLRIVEDEIGKKVELDVLTPTQLQEMWRSYGMSEDDVAFLTTMKTDPPRQSLIPTSTVQDVAGRPGLSFREWLQEHKAAFQA